MSDGGAQIRLIDCRLDNLCLRESMFLEDRGFKFVKMVNRPELRDVQAADSPVGDIEVLAATTGDVREIQHIASTAFGMARFHVDPRLGAELGNRRYSGWVWNSVGHPTQRILKDVLVTILWPSSWSKSTSNASSIGISPRSTGSFRARALAGRCDKQPSCFTRVYARSAQRFLHATYR
ncbi:MAG: hypothetical protein ACREBC_21570 [Pyrinomonadaceae bacterium]